MPRIRTCLLLGLFLALTAGCTRIVVYEGDGEVRVENAIGVVRLTTQPGRQPQIIQSNGLGLFLHDGAFTMGYFSADMALLPLDDCRIVVWLDKAIPPELLNEISASGEPICQVGPGAQTRRTSDEESKSDLVDAWNPGTGRMRQR